MFVICKVVPDAIRYQRHLQSREKLQLFTFGWGILQRCTLLLLTFDDSWNGFHELHIG